MRTWLRSTVASMAIVSILAGCAGTPAASTVASSAPGATNSGAATPLTRLSVTVAQAGDFMGWGALYVAAGKGYFDEQGLNVDFVRAQGGPAVMAALLSGNADFSTSTMGEIFSAVAQVQGSRGRTTGAPEQCGLRHTARCS